MEEAAEAAEAPGSGISSNVWASSCEIMSLSEICSNVQHWYDPNFSESTDGHKSTKLGRKQPLPATFVKDFPDAEVIKISDVLRFCPKYFGTGLLFEI